MPDSLPTGLGTLISCPECSFQRTVPTSKYKKGVRLKCPECGTAIFVSLKLVFGKHSYRHIHPDAFTHPLDRMAIAALRKVPGLDLAIRKMMEYSYEKICRVEAMAKHVKVTPKTCGYIHDMAEQAANNLGIAVPDVYISQDPVPNAWTIGTEFPLISIQSGLIELTNEDELYAVIAHEMGHIKCHHVLYHMLASFLRNVASVFGAAGYVIAPLNLALLEWYRKSELSADRAALLVTRNEDAVIKLLMKLAGGSWHISEMIDHHEFVMQARQFEELTKGLSLNKFYRMAGNVLQDHPYAVLRAHEIHEWASSKEYDSVRSGNYVKKSERGPEIPTERKCPQCGAILDEKATYCETCGQAAERLLDQYKGEGLEDLKAMANQGFNYLKGLFDRDQKSSVSEQQRVCPSCGQVYTSPDSLFCTKDGSKLV